MHKAPEMLAAAVVVAMIFSFKDLILILTGSGSTEEAPDSSHCPLQNIGEESIRTSFKSKTTLS